MNNVKCANMTNKAECLSPVSFIDTRGFIYCEHCGQRRQQSEQARKLTDAELKTILSGKPIKRY